MEQHFNSQEDKSWYALSVKVNCEKNVQKQLIGIGIDCFVPLVSTIRIWSDRKKKIKIPLIPAIVFVKCSKAELRLAYDIRNVFGPIKHLGKPAAILEKEMSNLRILSDQEFSFESIETRALTRGAQVQVLEGPFNGIHGVVIGRNQSRRISINVESLGKSFVLDLPSGFVIPYEK
jgi:transcription antitermination factor NusG